MAHDGGPDGLDVLRRVIAAAPRWLAPGGHLLVETSRRQAPQTVDAIARTGLIPRLAGSDERNATVAIGTSPILRNGPGQLNSSSPTISATSDSGLDFGV